MCIDLILELMIGSQDVICKNIEFYFNLGVQVFKRDIVY